MVCYFVFDAILTELCRFLWKIDKSCWNDVKNLCECACVGVCVSHTIRKKTLKAVVVSFYSNDIIIIINRQLLISIKQVLLLKTFCLFYWWIFRPTCIVLSIMTFCDRLQVVEITMKSTVEPINFNFITNTFTIVYNTMKMQLCINVGNLYTYNLL